MGFVQTIEYYTSKFEDIEALRKEWQAATEGKRTLRRGVVLRDRDDDKRYVVLAFFDSRDSAMVNSDLPETTRFAKQTEGLLDKPPVFRDFDVIDDHS